jgi:hypothetical protein
LEGYSVDIVLIFTRRGAPSPQMYGPETWVTVCTGDMGYNLVPNGLSIVSSSAGLCCSRQTAPAETWVLSTARATSTSACRSGRASRRAPA